MSPRSREFIADEVDACEWWSGCSHMRVGLMARRCSSRGDLVCGISHIGKVFQVDFSFAQSSMKCLISRSSSEL
jgi:hypothetical protein